MRICDIVRSKPEGRYGKAVDVSGLDLAISEHLAKSACEQHLGRNECRMALVRNLHRA
jgi:hypothetical protein